MMTLTSLTSSTQSTRALLSWRTRATQHGPIKCWWVFKLTNQRLVSIQTGQSGIGANQWEVSILISVSIHTNIGGSDVVFLLKWIITQKMNNPIFQQILDSILPHYLEFIKQQTMRKDNASAAREEINSLCNIAASMRALVSSCEPLARYEWWRTCVNVFTHSIFNCRHKNNYN